MGSGGVGGELGGQRNLWRGGTGFGRHQRKISRLSDEREKVKKLRRGGG